MKRTGCTAVLLAAIAIPSCQRAPLTGPPELRLGRDMCAECGMIISEDACASATLVEREGVREHALFDDIGCMLDYASEHAGSLQTVESFVRDYSERSWASSSSSWFLLTDGEHVRTPMASGIVAFATSSAAQAAQARWGGKVVQEADLPAARDAVHRERQGIGASP
ncbi:MAG: nitrous oxide reductase accessory protein NosL [Phycisphaerales bacterium]|nr:nitrous oxide reductase accessory protein NosL [Phycisphaerales bacterium]